MLLSFVRGFEDMQVPAKPSGYLELECFKQSDGSLSLTGGAWEDDDGNLFDNDGKSLPKVKLPVLGKIDRCEKTDEGWRG
jgi:hypothetical protein